jgi:hypothetical protein
LFSGGLQAGTRREEGYRFKLSQGVCASRHEIKGGRGSLRLEDELIRVRNAGSETDSTGAGERKKGQGQVIVLKKRFLQVNG